MTRRSLAPILDGGQKAREGQGVRRLIELGSTSSSIRRIQNLAAKAMEANNLGYTLHNACAATLSTFLREAGVNVPITLGAGRLAQRLENDRQWKPIAVGRQQAGDVGVTYDLTSPAGADHIYLVIQSVNSDEMLIADNQAPRTHQRFASGRGKTPTKYFLRAVDTRLSAESLAPEEEGLAPLDEEFYPWADEDSNGLREPEGD